MKLMFNGRELFGPRGPAGPDGNPIGTVISFMGQSAPADYLACDGSAYPIKDYSKLAEFFKEQFGSANHFGGDGEATFAVPDLRNLFLRGYHGDAEEQLSEEIGTVQNATEHPSVSGGSNISFHSGGNNVIPQNIDLGIGSEYANRFAGMAGTANILFYSKYTSRPVNMAVLYCIKAAESFQAQDIYSTEETRIGTWIDGKPLYRRTLVITQDYNSLTHVPIDGFNIDTPVSIYGFSYSDKLARWGPLNYDYDFRAAVTQDGLFMQKSAVYSSSIPAYITVEYTKTTD